jgi:hypothetical protein
VRWAYDGIADLVDHVGGDVSQIRCEPAEPEALYRGDRTKQMQLRYVVTISDTQAYGLAWNAVEPWRVGAELLKQLHPADRIATTATMPEAGMHLDPITRTAGVWSSVRPLRGLAERWPRLWPDWTLQLWDDRSSEQLQRCAGSVNFPVAEPLGPRRLAESVMRTWSFFVVEDIDDNYRAEYGSDGRAKRLHKNALSQAREHTRITRRELSTALEAITGRPWPVPRWPDFKEPPSHDPR